ncbi:MAG: uroporphyrinogen-III C-methyltransferase, partial [Gammaproteobacteria bacterium]
APKAQPAPKARSTGVGFALFALLVALAAAGGAAYTWWLVGEQRHAAAEQRADSAERITAIRDLVAGTQERLAVQEERLGVLRDDVRERSGRLDELASGLRQAQARLETLAREDAGPERSPSLAEIEFLLLLASRELALADNPRVALAALREADRRAARLNDPGLGEMRAAINDEIAAVEAVADIDIDGLALRLASLARRVEGLPLRGSLAPDPSDGPAADESATGWDRTADRLRGVASRLFRIRRTDAPAAPLLAPDETFFLYRNVELDLKSARLAVLSRDQDNYAAGLTAALDTLRDYFETSDDAVKALIEGIDGLKDRELAPEWPEIRRSVTLLRAAEAAN